MIRYVRDCADSRLYAVVREEDRHLLLVAAENPAEPPLLIRESEVYSEIRFHELQV
jgi:hypothetical protein